MADARAPRPRRFPGEEPPPMPRPRSDAPPLDQAVVEWLEALAPEVGACGSEELGGLMFAHGRRSLALRARAEFEKQQEIT